MANLTLLDKMSCMATVNNFFINTWQSWDFNPTSLSFFNYTRLLIFEEYPCGTFTWWRYWQKLIFSFLDKVWQAGGKYIFFPSDIGCNYDRIPMSARSWQVFRPYFVLPWILRSVPMKLSHTFFSTCITSIQCLTIRSDQSGRSKKMDLFFHMQLLLLSFFRVFPNIVFRCSIRWKTCSPVNGIRAVSCSWLPLKAFFNRL